MRAGRQAPAVLRAVPGVCREAALQRSTRVSVAGRLAARLDTVRQTKTDPPSHVSFPQPTARHACSAVTDLA
jgi:hypothetical protein